jgi:hypothetical protein
MVLPDGSTNSENSQLDELLAAHTDALLAGLADFDPQFTHFGIASSQAAEATDLLGLAFRLRETLTPVAPSDEFTRRLRNELVGAEQPVTLLVRWRKLPAHYQLAAKLGGLTLTAGLLLLASRRAIDVLNTLQHREQPEVDQGLTLHTA